MRQSSTQYIVYTRKSTDDQENQKNSLPYQVEENLKYARANGLAIATTNIPGVMDKGVIQEKHSGYATSDIKLNDAGQVVYDIERPKFQRMAQALLKREFKGVICLCWDRISRNEQDGLLIKKMMDSGVDVRFVQATYDKSSAGALHRDIDGMFSQHYSRVISEKVRNTFDKFRREGRCLGPAPIGYLDQGSACKPFDPIRAPLVRRIFDLYATGEWSFQQLAHWASQQGLTTKPSRYRRSRHEMSIDDGSERPQVSKPVISKTIEHMLANPFYIGIHKDKYGNSRQCKHAPLVATQVFQKVQNAMAKRNVGIHPVAKAFFSYRALLRCSDCGRSYSPYQQKGITYYRSACKKYCSNKTVNLTSTAIDEAIAAKLDDMCFTDQELAEIDAGAKAGLDHIAEKRTGELADLDRERNRIFADLDYLKKNKITLLRTAATTAEEFALDVARLETELEEIYAKMEVYKEAESDMLQFVLTFSELVKAAGQRYRDALDSDKYEITTTVFSELNFGNGIFEFTAHDGFSAVFSRASTTKNTQPGLSAFSGSVLRQVFERLPNLYQRSWSSNNKLRAALKLTSDSFPGEMFAEPGVNRHGAADIGPVAVLPHSAY